MTAPICPGIKITDVPNLYIALEQLYPPVRQFFLNTCGNPDCVNYCTLPDFTSPIAASSSAAIAAGAGRYKSATWPLRDPMSVVSLERR